MDVFSFPDAWGEIADSIAKGYGLGNLASDLLYLGDFARASCSQHILRPRKPEITISIGRNSVQLFLGIRQNIAQYRSEDIRSGWAVRLIRNGFYRTIRVDDVNIVIQYL
jgi:hypothetical protein